MLLDTEQPALVCNVISLAVAEFTPSMISISPFVGQFGPTIQLKSVSVARKKASDRAYKAGHVPHIPPGMWARSRMMSPWL